MFQRFLAFMLSIVMVLSMMPVPAFAQDGAETEPTAETTVPAETQEEALSEETEAEPISEETEIPVTEPEYENQIQPRSASGDCSAADSWNQTNDVAWNLDDNGTLTISGTGAMASYSESSAAPWFSERLNIKRVVVEEGVTSVGSYAFYYCVYLKDVSIAETVTSLGSYAFSKCTALESIVVPEGVKTLGSSCFSGDTALASVSLPSTLTTINNYCFSGCTALPAIGIPASVTLIYYGAFYGCSALKNVDLPEGINSVGSYLFQNCSNLETVSIPDSVTTISSEAFRNCVKLKEIHIPAGVTSIGNSAFNNCPSLTEVILPSGLSYIDAYCFNGCTGLTEITVPKGVAKLNSGAFAYCANLTKVTLPSGLVTIGSEAFEGCSSLDNVVLPDGTATIGYEAFRACTSLKNITIPTTVTSLGERSFYYCTSLVEIDIPNSVTTISNEAFRGCSALEIVEFPEKVTAVGHSTFRDCTSLVEIVLADTMTVIPEAMFSGCAALEQISLPAALETVYASAFSGCSSLESIDLPTTVTSIGRYAFGNCDALTEVTLPESLPLIPYQVFYGCDSLAKVTIPASVTEIGEAAFAWCPKLTEIQFCHKSGDTLSIYSDAFYIHDYYSSNPDVATTVSVPYARDINAAILDFDWEYYGRNVTFRSYEYLPAETVTIGTHPAQVEAGLSVQFTAEMDPWYGTSDLVWEVKNVTGEATIDQNGLLLAVEPGYVTVICKSTDDASVCDETQLQILKATANVSSITIRCAGDIEAEMEVGTSVQMLADVQPGNAMNKEVSWEVENGTGTATISEDGLLTGLTCGTVTVFAIAQDGSEVIGSRVVEIMRYVTDIKVMLNGQEEFTQLGVSEKARLTTVFSPEDANYPNGTVSIENGTGEATYYNGYLTGVTAGTVTLKVVANDSRQLTVTREIEIVGEQASYTVAGGCLYYNTVTGTVTGCDEGVTSANIPAIINGTRITAIAPQAFYDRNNLTSVTIPSSVTVIGEEAFYSCENIASLRFNGTGLKIIGDEAFMYCRSLVNLTVPAGVETVGSYAFYDCDGLTNLIIPEGVKSFGRNAFDNLSYLKNLTIPGDYDTRGWLSYNDVLETVTFTGTRIHPGIRVDYSGGGYGIESIPGRYAKKVIITDTVTEIGEYAFYSRDCIEQIEMGSGVTTIGKYAFHDCDGLISVTVGEKVKSIGDYGFANCDNLKEVILPEGLETLGERTFYRCYDLESLNLPDSLKSVGRYCFSAEKEGGSKLQLIDLSGNPSKLAGQELKLEYSLPKALATSAGQNSEIWWSFVYTWEDQEAGKPNPYEIAYIDGQTGTLYAHGNGVGTVTVMCYDEYTGACGTWTIEIASGVTIRTDREEDYLTSGDTMQLYAYIMPGDIKTSVEWSVREQDKEYATINSKGVLAARAVTGAKQIQVTATPYDGGESATLTLWIVPRTTGLYIYEGDGDVTGLTLDIDSSVYPALQLDAVAYPEGALTDVYWKTSDEDVASVDNGLVTFNGLGAVTISVYAADGSGKSASVKLNVTYRESAKKLTASVDAENNTLRAGEQTQMYVFGDDPEVPMDPSLLEFGIPDSQKEIATVDADGLITAGEKAGTVTVTASLAGDPLGRRVSLKITVEPRLTEKLLLQAQAEEPAQIQWLDENGNVTLEEDRVVSHAVLLKKADVEADSYSFVICPKAFNSAGEFQPEKNDLKWASSNTKVATVAVQKDGTAIVTVKQGATGACAITAVTTDKAKVENQLTLNVQDFSPRLETLKPVLNTYLTEAAELTLVPSYENWITQVELLEKGEISTRLTCEYADGVLTLYAKETIPNSTLALTLRVTCQDGEAYEYALSAKVKNVAPAVTVKQQGKFNLFYSDSMAVLKITASGAEVSHVDLVNTDDFVVVEYDAETALAYLRFSDSYILDHSAKADAKADLLVYLEGYEQPVKKSVTVATTNQKPAVVLTAASSIINTAISDDHSASFGFQLKGSTQLLDLDHAQVDVAASFAEAWLQGDRVALGLTGSKGGTATVKLQLDNWMNAISLTHKVTVETKKPALKFGASALKLSSIFTDAEAQTAALLTHSNLEIASISFEAAAKAGTDARTQSDKITLSYDPDTAQVLARIADPEDAPKKGSYTFNAFATLPDGTVLTAAKLKITVDASAPKVKLSSSTLKLNKVLCGDEAASVKVTLDKAEEYALVGFQLPEDWDLPLDIEYVDGCLTARLTDAEASAKTHSVKLYPVVRQIATGQEVVLSTATTLRIQVYSNDRITVSLSAKGKLDVIDPNSEIRYTVSKITNANGPVTGVSLAGDDAELFDAVLNEDGTVSLKLLPGEAYSVKKTYKVKFCFCICGMDVESSAVSFKITQSALKLKAAPAVCTLYQSQTTPVTLRLSLTDTFGYAMESVTLSDKSNQAFLNAMGAGELDAVISEDGRSAVVELDVRNAARLQFGKSYVLYLDVAAVGSAEDGKINQLKVTVNVAK